MPKFIKNPNSFMKKYSASGVKHAKPSPGKFFDGTLKEWWDQSKLKEDLIKTKNILETDIENIGGKIKAGVDKVASDIGIEKRSTWETPEVRFKEEREKAKKFREKFKIFK